MSTDRRVHSDNIADEIFTEGDLRQRTGQDTSKWGRYVLKELLDNSLDHMDEGKSPSIQVELGVQKKHITKRVTSITVTDNGPGITEDTLNQVLGDITSFAGTKKHYCLPTRGNQGNALMTVLGIQYLCDEPLQIETNGYEYRITATNDARKGGHVTNIEQVSESGVDGTSVTVDFGDKCTNYTRSSRVINEFYNFVVINPQSEFDLLTNGEECDKFESSNNPTGSSLSLRGAKTGKATWFSPNDFKARLEADIGVEPNLSIEEFVKEFCGLRSKGSEVVSATPDEVDTINDLFDASGQLRDDIARGLYQKMKGETNSYSEGNIDSTLGSIGKDLIMRTTSYAAREGLPEKVFEEIQQSDSTSNYNGIRDIAVYYGDGAVIEANENDASNKDVPFYFELCAIPTGVVEETGSADADVFFGINQSVSYSTPSFSVLEYKAGNKEKSSRNISHAVEQLGHDFTVVCNLTCPNIDFQDRGKQQFNTGPFTEVISDVVGKTVRKLRRDIRPDLNKLRTTELEDKEPSLSDKKKAPHGFVKDFIFDNFRKVYNEATEGGKYSLEMRQFFYAMRPYFQEEKQRRGYEYSSRATYENPKSLELRYGTFTNNVGKYEEEELGDRLIIRDERGKFTETHSNEQIPLATGPVKEYEPDFNQYGNLLFVEKTGFKPLIHEEFQLSKKYDLGLVNAKGYSTLAARDLVEKIQSEGDDVTIYALTDFDIAGMGIASDLKNPDDLSAVDMFDTERVGVALQDVEKYDLPIESGDYSDKELTRLKNQYEDGEVSEEAYDFLTDNGGQRVEINAFSPAELRDYLETKFEELGIEKVEPDENEVDTPEVDDPEEARDESIEQAVGGWVMNKIEEDLDYDELREAAFSDGIDTVEEVKDELGSGGVPTGEEASKTIYDQICEELADKPPKSWKDLNAESVEDHEDTAENIIEDYSNEVKKEVNSWLSENEDKIIVEFDGLGD